MHIYNKEELKQKEVHMAKPFIKLLRTPNSGYFYDVGKNEIIILMDEMKAGNIFQYAILHEINPL